MNILESKEGLIKICFSSNQVLFEFPNYQDIIPTKFKTHIVLKRDEFLNQIKTASLFSGKVNEVKISVNKEKQEVEIFAASADVGENTSTLPVKVEGESI